MQQLILLTLAFSAKGPGVECYSIVLKQIAHFNMFTCEIRHVDHPIPP